MTFIELNIDGLVGPTHHYAGLAFGNEASMQHANEVSYPKKAALQGLKKMRLLHELGLKQAILPPPPRPNFELLKQLGFTGSNEEMLKQAFNLAPRVLSAVYSASSMWAANAATVSAAPDTKDGKVHFTPANLVSSLHRAQESSFTAKALRYIFQNEDYFIHHNPLPSCMSLADEGAANVNRLCFKHQNKGLMLFVYGQTALDTTSLKPKVYPARQTNEACQAIARAHGLDKNLTLFAQQNPNAIDKGVFHNDVIALANEYVFLLHKEAFLEQDKLLATIQKKSDSNLKIIEIASKQLSLEEAVKSYFFNSQLVTLPNQTMCLVAPEECQQEPRALALINGLINDKQNPIDQVFFIDLKQSMHNGGGPACLRLRIPLSMQAFNNMHKGVLITNDLLDKLEHWVYEHYRDTLSFMDLIDPNLALETQRALITLEQILKLSNLYRNS